MDFLIGAAGALVGGFFVLAGTFLQGRLQRDQQRYQFEYQRQLAGEDHARRQAALENDRLRERIESQLERGRRVLLAACRFQSGVLKEATPTQALFDALKFAGVTGWDEALPYHTWVSPEEIEDSELRAGVEKHRTVAQDVELRLAFADRTPSGLPPNCDALRNDLDDFAKSIRVRIRQLQRAGVPF
jgi:hypothetical protein